jgi:hypothetical protein
MDTDTTTKKGNGNGSRKQRRAAKKAVQAEQQAQAASVAVTKELTWEKKDDGFSYATGAKAQYSVGYEPYRWKRIVLGQKAPSDFRFKTIKSLEFSTVEEAQAKASELDQAPAAPAAPKAAETPAPEAKAPEGDLSEQLKESLKQQAEQQQQPEPAAGEAKPEQPF